MCCEKCLNYLREEVRLKPEYNMISLDTHKSTTVRIVDGKFEKPIPTFKLFLTVDRKLKNGKLKREVSEVIIASKFCPRCGDEIKEK